MCQYFDIMAGMGAKESVEQAFRRAVRESGLSMLQLCKRSGVGYQSIHAFVTQGRGLTLESVSKLAAVLGLELTPTKRRAR